MSKSTGLTLSLPKFPKFAHLEIGHKSAIEKLAHTDIEPYSDFIFSNLWAWNLDKEIEVSTLNGNLIILMPGYTGEYSVLTFDGIEKVDSTIETLLTHKLRRAGLKEGLEYIHGYVVQKIKQPGQLEILEERHNFDYIISLKDSVDLSSRKNKSRRHNIERFLEKYESKSRDQLASIGNPSIQRGALRLFDRWAATKTDTPKKDLVDERAVLTRFFKLGNLVSFEMTAIYVGDQMAGFTIDEIINKNYAVGHFMKALARYRGLYQYLEYTAALNLLKKGVTFLNIEQDLGIESLRESKLSQHPIQLLRKYRISSK